VSTILVTGATDGIGKETARILTGQGHDVIVHGRTMEKAQAVVRALGKGRAVAADLASLDAIRAMASSLRESNVDVLINNAGVYMKTRTLTPDGREMTMAVNHDAPFLLTHLLLAGPSGLARVVNVSSVAHMRGHVDVDDIDLARGFDGYAAYASSKLANVLFSVELAQRAPHVQVNALHPGVVSTKLLRAGFNMGGPDSHEDGAATSVYLATTDVNVSGRYFVRSREATPHADANDAPLCAAFYEASCRRVGVTAQARRDNRVRR
jgi:NAD(P)-dependent dehydrogenase (short-subunit alcohol dehydrogenase family)